jgi:colicin import membrane protein
MAASMKEVRALVKAKAKEAEAWARLDEELGQAIDLDRVLASRQAEVKQCEEMAAKERLAARDAAVQVNQLLAAAKTAAERVKADAEKTKADAERRAAAVDAILADARAKAGSIVDQGRVAGKELAEKLNGDIPKLQATLKAMRDEETRIANAVAALEQRAAKAEARLAELRADLAKIA